MAGMKARLDAAIEAANKPAPAPKAKEEARVVEQKRHAMLAGLWGLHPELGEPECERLCALVHGLDRGLALEVLMQEGFSVREAPKVWAAMHRLTPEHCAPVPMQELAKALRAARAVDLATIDGALQDAHNRLEAHWAAQAKKAELEGKINELEVELAKMRAGGGAGGM